MSVTSFHRYFEDVAVGQEWESLGRTITEADIVNFAGLSGDFNPIHIDHQFAATTPFRRRPSPPSTLLTTSRKRRSTAVTWRRPRPPTAN